MDLNLPAIADQFTDGQTIFNIARLGKGLINDTYLVTSASTKFVLQRINKHVFPQPEQIMSNLQQLNRHIRQKPAASVRLQIPAILLSRNNSLLYLDQNQQLWRALELIHPSESRDRLRNKSEAEQVGFALAHFHKLCSDLPVGALYDTLPDFHITPNYFHDYQCLIQKYPQIKNNSKSRYCQTFIESFRDNLDTLETAKQQGLLIERVIHGDPKLNNFLFKPDLDQIISLIDLDTVKPGLVHYDIGDCLRSCCHVPDGNRFNLIYCQTILKDYLLEAGHFFTAADYDYLYSAIILIPFELGLRFFSDYLAGNQYFKISYPEQNLQRAIAQFELCENITNQRTQIENIISRLRSIQ